jgi:hypothetical protein
MAIAAGGRRLSGVMEITNSAGTAIDRTTVRIRIR